MYCCVRIRQISGFADVHHDMQLMMPAVHERDLDPCELISVDMVGSTVVRHAGLPLV
jgi:hypothetical protein